MHPPTTNALSRLRNLSQVPPEHLLCRPINATRDKLQAQPLARLKAMAAAEPIKAARDLEHIDGHAHAVVRDAGHECADLLRIVRARVAQRALDGGEGEMPHARGAPRVEVQVARGVRRGERRLAEEGRGEGGAGGGEGERGVQEGWEGERGHCGRAVAGRAVLWEGGREVAWDRLASVWRCLTMNYQWHVMSCHVMYIA